MTNNPKDNNTNNNPSKDEQDPTMETPNNHPESKNTFDISDIIDFDALNGTAPPREHPEPSIYELPDAWWRTKARREIHQAASNGGGKPTPALFVALAHIASLVPPGVKAPRVAALQGYRGADPCSLNLMVAVVGKSGSGKGGVFKAAKAGLNLKPTDLPANYLGEANPVSGEALARIYSPKTEPGGLQGPQGQSEALTLSRTNALIANPEGNEITKRMAREGSTFLEAVLKAIYGESLSSQRADETQNRHVPEDTYSLGIAIGMQPSRAADLTQQTDSGFTQRVICVPIEANRTNYDETEDDAAYRAYLKGERTPDPTRYWSWKPPKPTVEFLLSKECHVRLHRLLNHVDCDTGQEADQHLPGMLNKLMCLLVLLDNPNADGQINITPDYLRDAETLLGIHSLGRSLITNELIKRREQHAETQARIETQLEDKKQAINNQRLDADVERIIAKLKELDQGKGVGRNKLRRLSIPSPNRFDAATEQGRKEGLLHQKLSPNGQGYRIYLGEEVP